MTDVKVPFLDVKASYRELQPDLDEAYRRVMASGQYILGSEVEAFEKEFAEYCGVKCRVRTVPKAESPGSR